MALQFCDDFSGYGTGSRSASYMTDGLYAFSACTCEYAPPSYDGTHGYALLSHDGTNEEFRRVLSTGKQTLGLAFRVYMTSLPANSSHLWAWRFNNGSNVAIIYIRPTSTGAIEVYSRQSGVDTLIGATSGPVLTANAFHHVEVKVYSHATDGTVDLYVNGIQYLALTSKNTNGDPIKQVQLYNNNGALNYGLYFKDLVCYDDGGSYMNDIIGTVSVISLAPASDVSFNWTPSSGTTGYNLIDEAAPNDSSFISADDSPPAASTFAIGSLPADVSSVKAIVTRVRAQKIDGGDGNLQVSVVSNGSESNGSDRPITTAFTFWEDIHYVDPDTTSPFTPSAVDDSYLKVDRTT